MIRLLAAVGALAAMPAVAGAHGPCGCLSPATGPPGTEVHAAYPIYKVILNPDRADLAIGPEELWARHHGGPPVTVYRRTWRYSRRPPNRGGTFTVPTAEPGRYLVALYDGGEGGVHYSWETFELTAAAPRPPAREPGSGGVSTTVLVGGLVAALLAGAGAGAGAALRRRTS